VGGGDVVLPVAHLQLKVAEAALQDDEGDVVEGCEGRHMATAASPVRQSQLLRQVRSCVVPRQGIIL
jgi:hypothetical protein